MYCTYQPINEIKWTMLTFSKILIYHWDKTHEQKEQVIIFWEICRYLVKTIKIIKIIKKDLGLGLAYSKSLGNMY